MVTKAVILARGLGTRMQREQTGLQLDAASATAAGEGAKAMIPVAGRPFLDYSLQELIDAGFEQVCLVVAPGRSRLMDYYREVSTRLETVRLSFAIQAEPRGTADAVAAARGFTGDDRFVSMNCDNLYGVQLLRTLRGASPDCCHVVAHPYEMLRRDSNLDEVRLARWAKLLVDEAGNVLRIATVSAGPTPASPLPSAEGQALVSPNLFSFTSHIFDACETIAPNPANGEYELPAAVQHLIDANTLPVKALLATSGLLDLTSRTDIVSVAARLSGRTLSF